MAHPIGERHGETHAAHQGRCRETQASQEDHRCQADRQESPEGRAGGGGRCCGPGRGSGSRRPARHQGRLGLSLTQGSIMRIKRKKIEAGLKTAAAAAAVAGRKAASKLALVGDETLVKLGDAARRRRRARTTKAVLKGVGKAALVTGVVVAGRAALKRGK